jgi:hypothetical protein
MLEDAKTMRLFNCRLQTDQLTAQEKTDRHKSWWKRTQLKGCVHVDEIVLATEQDLEDILRSFKIDANYGDYQIKFTGRSYCDQKE